MTLTLYSELGDAGVAPDDRELELSMAFLRRLADPSFETDEDAISCAVLDARRNLWAVARILDSTDDW